jgi:hypothetical protein
MNVLLANDTATVAHVGCQGVSDGHARMLGRAGHHVKHRLFLGSLDHHVGETDDELIQSLLSDDHLVAQIDEVDAVVVNGEGTIHHGAGRPLLALLAVAQARGKPTLLVNAVFQETAGFDDTLQRLDDFTTRESRSCQHALARGFRARVVPDSILSARFEPANVRLRGELYTDAHWQRSEVTSALQNYAGRHLATPLPLHYPGALQDWSTMVSKVSEADLIVTGRHHGIYLAILAGLPFVAMGSNTFKVEGVLEDIDMRLAFAHDVAGIVRARAWALERRDAFRSLLDRLTGGAALSTFAALGTDGDDRERQEVEKLRADLAVAS